MPDLRLKDSVLEILTNLEPHLPEARALRDAVEAGIDESRLSELATLLADAGKQAMDSESFATLRKTAESFRKKIEEESAVRGDERHEAETTVARDFP